MADLVNSVIIVNLAFLMMNFPFTCLPGGSLHYNALYSVNVLDSSVPRPRWWSHDDVIKCKHFLCYWPFVRGIHRSPVNSAHKGQWRGVLMFSLICAWIKGWVNSGEAVDLRCHHAHYDVTVMDFRRKNMLNFLINLLNHEQKKMAFCWSYL